MADRLVTVATFGDPVEAAMARNALEAGGIRTYLRDEEAVAVNWSLGNALGGIKLQVNAWDFERAELLLSRQAREAAEQPPAEQALETALTTAEAAEELRHERAEQAPANRCADRAFRAAVFGLLFWPIQLYATWMLLSLLQAEGTVTPDRRWKVWAAVVINIPMLLVGSACMWPICGIRL
jgi:hypothetical protein